MTPQEVADATRVALDNYRPPLGLASPLGRPASPSEVSSAIAVLRRALVVPSLRRVSSPQIPRREVWLVAKLEGFPIFFDEGDGEYGLGMLEADGRIEDINVRGDLVGCFMAR